jgi:hypothetical protein
MAGFSFGRKESIERRRLCRSAIENQILVFVDLRAHVSLLFLRLLAFVAYWVVLGCSLSLLFLSYVYAYDFPLHLKLALIKPHILTSY